MPLRIYSEEEARPLSKVKSVLAVAAGKGGVGKSTITVNLALAFAQLGVKVGILDADIYGPSVCTLLPVEQKPSQKNDVLYPGRAKNIEIMTMGFFRQEGQAAAVRAPIANSVVRQFIENVRWGSLDVLLIDFPPGTGDIQLTLCQKAQVTQAVLVTTPQALAVADVKKAIDLFRQVAVPLAGVVENMSTYQGTPLFGEGGGEELAHSYQVPLLGKIPLDPLLCRCSDRGESILETDPLSPACQPFLDIASQLIPKEVVK
ncbi:MAG: Mrp/NBP35 family ATP-binding protein [Chlamydiia bacterium]|nr:Mrp/NBP35 family ATP-binding protein [Chlamydiia bacterium]